MPKRIVTKVETWCDHPGCTESESQPTTTTEFWVNAIKGRKTSPIQVELCETHLESLREVYRHMHKFDQSVVV